MIYKPKEAIKKMSHEHRIVCDILAEAIKDEEKAPEMYERLLNSLQKLHLEKYSVYNIDSIIGTKIARIIEDEKHHKKVLEEIASNISCDVLETEMLIEKDQYKLPLKERVRRAREFVSRF